VPTLLHIITINVVISDEQHILNSFPLERVAVHGEGITSLPSVMKQLKIIINNTKF